MMMALGPFVFSLATLAYQQLQRQMAWRHASSERIGARAAYQYLGTGEETVEMSGVIHHEITGGPVNLDQVRELAKTGQPWPLVTGLGEVMGSFVITAVNETQTIFERDGRARKIEFSLSLTRVDPPGLGEGA